MTALWISSATCFLHPQNSVVCFQEGISLLLLARGLKLFCFDGCRMLWDCIWSILLWWREPLRFKKDGVYAVVCLWIHTYPVCHHLVYWKTDDPEKVFSALPSGGSLSYLKSLLFFGLQKGLAGTCNCQFFWGQLKERVMGFGITGEGCYPAMVQCIQVFCPKCHPAWCGRPCTFQAHGLQHSAEVY